MSRIAVSRLERFCSFVVAIAFLTACGAPTAPSSGVPSVQLQQSTAFQPSNAAAAKPTQWFITVGAESKKGALEALDYYTNFITIDAGDSITWKFTASAHTVSFLLPNQSVYTAPLAPAGGTTENGKAFTSSGIQAAGSTYTLTFPKAGTYKFNCLLHPPEMAGEVVVRPAGSKYPHPQSYYNGYAKADMAADLQAAAASVKQFPYANGGNTIAAGIAPGLASNPPSQSTVYAFLGADKLTSTTTTVPIGSTVTWINQSNNEPHTVTFPIAGKPLPKKLAGNPFSPPMGGFTYDGTKVTNSGPFGPAYLGLGTLSYSLQFTKAGTYKYYCLFHFPFGMLGTIKVK
jgi:plastocyanin